MERPGPGPIGQRVEDGRRPGAREDGADQRQHPGGSPCRERAEPEVVAQAGSLRLVREVGGGEVRKEDDGEHAHGQRERPQPGRQEAATTAPSRREAARRPARPRTMPSISGEMMLATEKTSPQRCAPGPPRELAAERERRAAEDDRRTGRASAGRAANGERANAAREGAEEQDEDEDEPDVVHLPHRGRRRAAMAARCAAFRGPRASRSQTPPPKSRRRAGVEDQRRAHTAREERAHGASRRLPARGHGAVFGAPAGAAGRRPPRPAGGRRA